METNTLNIITDKIKELNPLKIILFGSRANNNQNESSDYDIYVLLDNDTIQETYEDKINLKLKVRKQLGEINYTTPIDLIVHTKPTYEKFINTSFAKNIFRNCVSLYEKVN